MRKNIVFLLFLSVFQSIVSANSDVFPSKNILYIHGFSGKPDGWKKLMPAISFDAKVTAPALPDTKTVTGIGLNKLISIATTLRGKTINRADSDLGHDKDIEAIVSNIPKESFVGYGICRGGSALINTIAKHNPEHVQALVLEAAYASYPKILYSFLSSYGIDTKYAEGFAKLLFPSYQIGAVSCQKAIPMIKNKKLPILLMHSKDDKVIPFEHSLMLYKEFKDNGFENVYLVQLKGQHAYSLRDDKDTYLAAIHSFYKTHGLPHSSRYATADMSIYQPDVAEVTKKLTKYYDKIKKKIEVNKESYLKSAVGKLVVVAAKLQKKS